MSDWQAVGAQRFRVEQDLISWDIHGDIAAFELLSIFTNGVKVQDVYGYALFLICAEGQWRFPQEARQQLAKFHQQHKAVGATAVVGLSSSMRLFLEVVLRAVQMVSGRSPSTRFFRTREEAMDWLGEQRVLGRKGLLKN